MDSTSNLFSHLDLTESNPDSRFKDMDDMDIDMIYDVADTSEYSARMGFRRKAHSCHRREPHRHVRGGGNTVSNETEQHRRHRIGQLSKESPERNECSLQAHDEILEFESNTVSDKSAKSVRSSERSSTIHGPVSYHHRHRGPRWKKGKEKYPVFDGGDVLRISRGKGREPDLNGDSFQLDASRKNLGQRKLGHSCFLSPCLVKGRYQTESGVQNIDDGVYDQGDVKGADTPAVSQINSRQRQGHLRQLHFASLPYNIAQGKNTTKDSTTGSMINDESLDGNLSEQYNISPDSEFMLSDKKKGKMILGDDTLTNAQYSKAKLHSDRLCSVKGKKQICIPDDYDALKSSEDISWISHNLRGKGHALVSQESASVSQREGNSSHLSNSKHINTLAHGDYIDLEDNSQPEPIECVGWQRRRRIMKGKRNHNSILSGYDGGSSSNFGNAETSDLQSPRRISNIRLSRDSQNYEKVDELQSSQLRRKNLHVQTTSIPGASSTSINQVESDEILARQLQEQFYDELTGSTGTEEMDSSLAWSLQEEDARQAASTLNQSDHREASMAHLYSYYAQLPFRNSSARLSNRGQARLSNRRRNFNSSEIDLETRMMEEMTNFSAMDLGRRRDIMDALEAAFDHSNDALEDHDFNENDYEFLLSLDDNIHQHIGASEIQINSLPQSIIQSDNSEEPCAICLENPSVGETIRHLPCLHKFHKECIDTWLGRRTWCPICKCEIS